MIRRSQFPRWIPQPQWIRLLVLSVAIGFSPCAAHAAGYIQHNLVSDIPLLADFTDPNLVNPWGITFSATSPFWVCDNRTGLSTVYTASATVAPGTVSTVVVTVPATTNTATGGLCTGIVTNATTGAFAPAAGVNASFIFATQNGTISARNGAVGVIKVDNSAAGAVYTGLALFNSSTVNFLYAANFHAGTIDVVDANYNKAALTGSFADPDVPTGFAPFNIQNLGGKLYVTYAKQDPTKTVDVGGAGNGYVAVFDTNGNLLQHLISGGPLNSPWGIQIAPASFGAFGGDLLVGNFRDGTINAFDPNSGAFLGTLQDPDGNPIVNVGLWALQFGNGGSGGFPTTLYVSAGISGGVGIQAHGLLAQITTTAPPAINANGIVNGASFATGALAPGSIAAVFGTNLTVNGTACVPPACAVTFRSDKRLNATLAGAEVEVNGVPAPMFYATPVQLGFQVPAELTAGSTASVQVLVDGESGPTMNLPIVSASPGVFNSGGAVTAVHSSGTLVSTTSPAALGETITLFVTGLGVTTPAVPTGELPSGATATVAMPTVTIDGLPAVATTPALSSSSVGVYQLNVTVPTNAHVANNILLVLSVGAQQSNTVTIATAQ